jgi:hypothetical protein
MQVSEVSQSIQLVTRIMCVSCVYHMCITCVSHVYRLYHTGIHMPDKLRFTDKLPVEWLSTAIYTKAALWLYKHDTVKNPRVHACTTERFLVLTTNGYDTYGKITNALIKRQREDSSDDDEQQAAVPALTW